jgi:hypothetical protein
MPFTATPEFHDRYRAVSDKTAQCIDEAILRIVGEPDSAWARQGQVRGELGAAWLVAIECSGDIWMVYWAWPDRDEPLQLLLLLPG